MKYDLSELTWRTSSYSSGNGQCVEIGEGVRGLVPVRDSKAPSGPALVFGAEAWGSFIAKLKTEGSMTR
ncbi:DUF397 domain-containing protein [Streptomyces sp. NPDC050617]|uniref:DUF397 domain-containing protein n=1 Tax=Streptomyces sp. NPDC050617 TaxID=3154628 RepID=UPI00342ADEBB